MIPWKVFFLALHLNNVFYSNTIVTLPIKKEKLDQRNL